MFYRIMLRAFIKKHLIMLGMSIKIPINVDTVRTEKRLLIELPGALSKKNMKKRMSIGRKNPKSSNFH